MVNPEIVLKKTEELYPNPNNPRIHSRSQVVKISKSIESFGFLNPILIDVMNQVVAGHGRLEAAKLLGLKEVPTIALEGLSKEQLRAYALADNRIAESAAWDPELLARELEVLSNLEMDFDLSVTGFDTAEIDVLLDGDDDGEDAGVFPEDSELPVVTQAGDLWELGRHRLLCGDALDAQSYEKLLRGQLAQMIFVDPPYNVPISGHVCGLGRIKHAEFAMASGEMTPEEFTFFLRTVCAHLVTHSAEGSVHFVCMDWRHLYELLTAARPFYSELKNLCVWTKSNGGMGSFYRSQHELICVFKNGTAPHINNIELGRHGRNRTNVWAYPGVNTFGESAREERKSHPTVKPVALVKDAILDCSKRGGIILDCFGGSGTTIIAAEKVGRRAYVIELEPKYVDVAIARWEKLTGKRAIQSSTGKIFEEVLKRRSRPARTRLVEG